LYCKSLLGTGLFIRLLLLTVLACLPLPVKGICSPRIVSLGPYLTQELYTLKAQDMLVGCTIYSPLQAASKPKVGSVVEVSIERIVALQPTLVLCTSLTRPGTIRRLKELGLQVEVFREPRNFAEICRQFMRLASLVGRRACAQRELERVKKDVAALRSRAEHLDRVRVFVEVGVRPLFTANKDSFLNELVELAGGVNIAKGSAAGIFSREEVVRRDPQVILIVTMGVVGEEEIRVWKRFPGIDAVKNQRVFVVDSDIFCSPTPDNFDRALRVTLRLLHPEAGP
jgi:ABC-type Fe3+-hydroxamate transport system substrate-binding protein